MTVMAILMEVMKMNNDAKGSTLVVGADRVVRAFVARASYSRWSGTLGLVGRG